VEKYCTARQDTDDRIIRRMRFAFRITNTHWIHTHTHTHSEYVERIAFPRQRWLGERVSILRYTHNAGLFLSYEHLLQLIHRHYIM